MVITLQGFPPSLFTALKLMLNKEFIMMSTIDICILMQCFLELIYEQCCLRKTLYLHVYVTKQLNSVFNIGLFTVFKGKG